MTFTFRKLLGSLALAVSALGAALPAAAAPYTSITIFGDSLSDTGNLFNATGGTQPGAGAYSGGRFSDGPLWVEHLAASLGLARDANPYTNPAASLPGNNYAYAGARTSTSSAPPGVLAQILGIWGPTHASADPNGLYVLVAGGNDLRDARSAFTTNSAADQLGRQNAAQAAVNNLIFALNTLAARGVHNILLANMPDLGNTPEAAFLGLQASSSDVSSRFNALVGGMASYASLTLGMNVDLLDLAGITTAVRVDALTNRGLNYGITNVSLPCAGFAFSAGAACSASAFSDALHPSAVMGRLVGQAALSLVPEPATWMLLAVGVVAMGLRRRAAVAG
jgi:outer membrane lipase/esterase